MQDTTLDLHDISALLNYERASTEPRFRGAKLREVAVNAPFRTVAILLSEWSEPRENKVGYAFDIPKTRPHAGELERDVPSNMLPQPVPPALKALSTRELETIYWQARGHDGCFKSVALLQHFLDLFPYDQPIRIRRGDGTTILTHAWHRVIMEFILEGPKFLSLSAVLPSGISYISGESPTLLHAVMGFAMDDGAGSVLDLSSMQFGEAGRGDGGRATFTLESMGKFHERTGRICRGYDGSKVKVSDRVGPGADDDWLMEVALTAKQRWEKRKEAPWCGFCGAPGASLRRCAACREVHYCDAEHQRADWAFHKKFCSGKK
ncbi:hypothetical protein BOTBODRAFT_71096 [Botryobasidium botryosum FD-172 SS1]|uniref:MYND-type domain-containing protein n=1 Tax=Botryobasidium botryosum (strain FD-172 SS1) TaxID=930990 RepID=A0A067M2K0_BOTB1|nr:hypothetical protein BOTBODRAFT_71096 [Botryobasidium botryosum FD-172 SS1]